MVIVTKSSLKFNLNTTLTNELFRIIAQIHTYIQLLCLFQFINVVVESLWTYYENQNLPSWEKSQNESYCSDAVAIILSMSNTFSSAWVTNPTLQTLLMRKNFPCGIAVLSFFCLWTTASERSSCEVEAATWDSWVRLPVGIVGWGCHLASAH